MQVPIIKKAQEMGLYVIAADDDPNAPGMKIADKAIVPGGLNDEEKMLAIAKEENIDAVIHPCSEVAMTVMGRINDEMHLHGISRETARRATNKYLMRVSFEAYGAPGPKSFCSADSKEGWRLFREMGCRAIIKPSRNSGSRGISTIKPDLSYDEFAILFEKAKSESRDASVMIEQFVDGPEFSIEIIVWNGTVNVLQVTDKKTTGAPYFIELGHSQPSLFPTTVLDAVKDAAIKGVKALRLNYCSAHAEVKYMDGKPYIMEIGARLGGDFISTDLTHLSTGIDMVAAAINVALGQEPCLTPFIAPSGVAIRYFTPAPGTVRTIEGTELLNHPDVYDAEIYVKPGDTVCPLRSSIDRSGHVIVRRNDVKEAIAEAEKLISEVKIITE